MASESTEIDLRETQLEHMGLPFAVTIPPGTRLEDCLKTMRENLTGSIIIQDEKRILGIFTERDFLMRVVGKNINPRDPIVKFMTRDVITISNEAHLEEAVKLIAAKGIRHLPTIDQNKKADRMLSARDIIDFFAEFFPKEVLNLPLDESQRFQKKEGG